MHPQSSGEKQLPMSSSNASLHSSHPLAGSTCRMPPCVLAFSLLVFVRGIPSVQKPLPSSSLLKANQLCPPSVNLPWPSPSWDSGSLLCTSCTCLHPSVVTLSALCHYYFVIAWYLSPAQEKNIQRLRMQAPETVCLGPSLNPSSSKWYNPEQITSSF